MHNHNLFSTSLFVDFVLHLKQIIIICIFKQLLTFLFATHTQEG